MNAQGTTQKVTENGDKAEKTAWGQQKNLTLGQRSGWWWEELQDVKTNSLFPSESQQELLKRKSICFPEIVKIFAKKPVTTKTHSAVLFISILASLDLPSDYDLYDKHSSVISAFFS